MNTRPMIYTAQDTDESIALDYDTVLSALREGEIDTEYGLMRWGSNYTFLVSVQQADTSFLAIYKPRMGERPLWDFPDGTLCQRETAAYELSEMLGWHIVPPTILRDASRGVGSVQVFIQHDPNEHYFTFDDDPNVQPQLMTMALFDAISNNADRKGGHCLLDESGYVWGIDHGLTFNTAHKLRTVIWDYAGQEIPAHLMADLESLCGQLDDTTNPQTQALNSLLNEMERRALILRVNKLLQTKIFPLPGAGPNRPWPAV